MYLISEIVKARPEIILSKKVDESIFETEGIFFLMFLQSRWNIIALSIF